MKLNKIAVIMALMALSPFSYANQSKYLGKEDKKEVSEAPARAKINLLDESITKRNPHYQNKEFWDQENSSVVVDTEVTTKSLSDSLFTIAKGASNAAKEELDMTNGNIVDKKEDQTGNSFKPPKTALIGHDHHHKYSSIENILGNTYDPSSFYTSIGGQRVKFSVTDRNWGQDNTGKSVLVSNLSINSNASVEYSSSAEFLLPVAEYFMESLLPLESSDIDITVLNENNTELTSSKDSFLLRDICLENRISGESVLVRANIKVDGLLIRNMKVFSGMRCGA